MATTYAPMGRLACGEWELVVSDVMVTQPPLDLNIGFDGLIETSATPPRSTRLSAKVEAISQLDSVEKQMAWAVLNGDRVAALMLADRLLETNAAEVR